MGTKPPHVRDLLNDTNQVYKPIHEVINIVDDSQIVDGDGMQNDCTESDEMWLQQLPTTPIQP
jgi:hypothetical protein